MIGAQRGTASGSSIVAGFVADGGAEDDGGDGCLRCQGAAARTWLEAREAELLPVGYFHVVFTLPAEVADIAFHNKTALCGLLFKAASDTMMTIAADPKHLDARIGVTAVPHTWGSAMTYHPHIHMIVPGGGIARDGTRWIAGASHGV